MTKPPRPAYSYSLVQAVCDVLGQTDHPGLVGTELDKLLSGLNASPRDKNVNKRTGLLESLYQAQQTDGQILIAFLTRAMAPQRYVKDPQRFENLRQQLNEVLIFNELEINKEGG